jgi:hypothetical protein
MDDHTFRNRFDAAVLLLQTGKTQEALAEIERLTSEVSDEPAQLLACRSEKANLLYHLGRGDESRRLLDEVVREQKSL